MQAKPNPFECNKCSMFSARKLIRTKLIYGWRNNDAWRMCTAYLWINVMWKSFNGRNVDWIDIQDQPAWLEYVSVWSSGPHHRSKVMRSIPIEKGMFPFILIERDREKNKGENKTSIFLSIKQFPQNHIRRLPSIIVVWVIGVLDSAYTYLFLTHFIGFLSNEWESHAWMAIGFTTVMSRRSLPPTSFTASSHQYLIYRKGHKD